MPKPKWTAVTESQLNRLQGMADRQAQSIKWLEKQLAECYRLSGADPDGNEDWRLGHCAVQEVRRLRKEYDDLEGRLCKVACIWSPRKDPKTCDCGPCTTRRERAEKGGG